MKKVLLKGLGLAASISLFAAITQSALGLVVYDNTTTRLPFRYGSTAGFEFGDEVFINPTGTFTVITNFTIEYFGTNFGGNEQARVRLYAMNGPVTTNSAGSATPGSELFDSGLFNISGTTGATLNFSELSIAAPPRFTWTIEFDNVVGGEQAGLNNYDPPTVGNNFDDFWERSTQGAWVLRPATNGAPMNFGARFEAVPEPSTLLLGALAGLISCAVVATRRKR